MSSVRCRGRNEAGNREKEHAVGNCGTEVSWRGLFRNFTVFHSSMQLSEKWPTNALISHLRLFIGTIGVTQTLRKNITQAPCDINTFSKRDVSRASVEQEATNQQLPSLPCVMSWVLAPLINSLGRSGAQISCNTIHKRKRLVVHEQNTERLRNLVNTKRQM